MTLLIQILGHHPSPVPLRYLVRVQCLCQGPKKAKRNLAYLYCMSQKVPFSYFEYLSEKWTDINKFWCAESWANFTSEKNVTRPFTYTMLLHYPVKCNLSDAACRIVDHTRSTSTGSCQSQSHTLTGEDLL